MLAGFPDDLADEGPAAGPASLVGLRDRPRERLDRPRRRRRDGTAGAAEPRARRPSRPTPRVPSPRPRSRSPAARRASEDADGKQGRRRVTDTLTPVLTDNWDADRAWTLASYEDRGGYARARRRRSAWRRTT